MTTRETLVECRALSRPSRFPEPPTPNGAPTAIAQGVVQALEHPLPAGLRDLLPREAGQHAAVASRLMRRFELYGYRRVGVPAFEYSAVLELGLGRSDGGALVRFVEPETGEVVALRPDMTPQVARLVATRMRGVPSPIRLCYQGSILRRRHERARQRRQITQVGFELIGCEGPPGDLEVLEVSTDALRAAGLERFTLDLANAQVASTLLGVAPADQRAGLVEALSMKDAMSLRRLGSRANLPQKILDALVALPLLHGQDDVFDRADPVLAGTPAEAALAALRGLAAEIRQRALVPDVVVDLGETWDLEYYTGTMFQILADGPGEPVGSGGRYDGLLARFGAPRPAAGFAIDLGNLCWALSRSELGELGRPRILVVDANGERARQLSRALRAAGVAAVENSSDDASAYAEALDFDWLLRMEANQGSLAPVRAENTSSNVAPTMISLTGADVASAVGAVIARVEGAARRPGSGA